MSTGKTRRKSLRPGTSSDEVCEITTDAKKTFNPLFHVFDGDYFFFFFFFFWGGGGIGVELIIRNRNLQPIFQCRKEK